MVIRGKDKRIAELEAEVERLEKTEMYFDNELGLVVDDQGDQRLYIPWVHVRGMYHWIMIQEKPYQRYAGHEFTRQQVGFILSNYEQEGE